MSREIKFRAYHKERKEIFEIASIDFEEKKVTLSNGIIKLLNVDFKQFELLQYTGLNDKNSKEIYENDLISCNKHKNIVVFFEGGCFKVKYLRNSTTTITCTLNSFLEKYKCKISGNIYENPELLEKNE
ncbi:YopX family protein [Leptotrichia trevisanii]|uniref:YopX family protein n=1 Tax=Leptotrichia trevisanii TaxID=109328 RepID=UPI0026EB1C49|nr:YopX family protein [Leptotrichia trevisanii]